jgi:hypothetical protein
VWGLALVSLLMLPSCVYLAALHSQAAALNRKKLETEANKRLEGGDQAAYLDHRAYMLLSTSSSSNGDATTLHDAEAAATHVRALSLAVGAVARRPGQAAASTKGGNAYQVNIERNSFFGGVLESSL